MSAMGDSCPYTKQGGSSMNINIGDRIKFKVALRWGVKTATRKVLGFNPAGWPEVSFEGYKAFTVRPMEILEVNGKDSHDEEWMQTKFPGGM
jgi:hypothetical protein